jgi:hypothetical protein
MELGKVRAIVSGGFTERNEWIENHGLNLWLGRWRLEEVWNSSGIELLQQDLSSNESTEV